MGDTSLTKRAVCKFCGVYNQSVWESLLYLKAEQAVSKDAALASNRSCTLHLEDWHPHIPRNIPCTNVFLLPCRLCSNNKLTLCHRQKRSVETDSLFMHHHCCAGSIGRCGIYSWAELLPCGVWGIPCSGLRSQACDTGVLFLGGFWYIVGPDSHERCYGRHAGQTREAYTTESQTALDMKLVSLVRLMG